MKIVVTRQGVVKSVYRDDSPLKRLRGTTTIERASDVEPDAQGKWWSHIRGTSMKLGPFELRVDAVKAEIEYLEQRGFLDGH